MTGFEPVMKRRRVSQTRWKAACAWPGCGRTFDRVSKDGARASALAHLADHYRQATVAAVLRSADGRQVAAIQPLMTPLQMEQAEEALQ